MVINFNMRKYNVLVTDIHMNTTHGFGCTLSKFLILFPSVFDGILWLSLSKPLVFCNPVEWIVLVRVSFGFGWWNASVADTTKYAAGIKIKFFSQFQKLKTTFTAFNIKVLIEFDLLSAKVGRLKESFSCTLL